MSRVNLFSRFKFRHTKSTWREKLNFCAPRKLIF